MVKWFTATVLLHLLFPNLLCSYIPFLNVQLELRKPGLTLNKEPVTSEDLQS